jgi:hypothetical protein
VAVEEVTKVVSSAVLVVGCTYKQNTDTIYITRKIKNKPPQVTAKTISKTEEKGTNDLSHKPQHNSATSKTKCTLCADDKISQDTQKFTKYIPYCNTKCQSADK